MDSALSVDDQAVTLDFFPYFRMYKDGRVERFFDSPIVPASNDHQSTGAAVRSKDVVISPENKVSARLFLPNSVEKDEKLPILIYFHGGAFAIESAFSSQYHSYVSSVVVEAKILAVSVEYRLAPENPLPACYEDAWAALNWVISHAKNRHLGPDPWITDHADFSRIFVAGDSAGGNIAHDTVARASTEGIEDGVKILGMILAHPYFGSGEIEKIWEVICSDSKGPEDPRLNPMAHPDLLLKLKCSKVLIFIAEKDFIRERGQIYYEALKNSGWSGELGIIESEGEEHCFHLKRLDSDNARILMERLVNFINK
ncbi:hypothetical protein M9H77_20385 [Catharanthus roseus]|uniref:Uncharacterized protein n=1 Tax=Catharanthus roseus TaxID=4058 RepID=A0ACC0AJG0_CATRO|nr:hypothetical protein M9H77_20385 [Catharanthus roseus]